MVDHVLYNSDRRVNLYCGKPILVLHDTDPDVLFEFCNMTTPWSRCTRIVIGPKTKMKSCDSSIIFVADQTEIEIAAWYASCDLVVTKSFAESADACGTPVVYGDALLDKIRCAIG